MTFYFALSLVATLLIVLVLLMWICHALKVNRNRENRLPISYFMPVLLSILLGIVVQTEFYPRLLDTIEIISENTYSRTFLHNEGSVQNRLMVIGDHSYILDPSCGQLKPETDYRIRVAPHTGMVVSCIEIVSQTESVPLTNQSDKPPY